MFKKSILKRICIFFSLVMLICAISPTNTFAETLYPTHNNGDYYLGHISNFTYKRGATRTYNGSFAELRVAWKAVDGGSDIDMRVEIYNETLGEVTHITRFTPWDDTAGRKDGDGYYYAVDYFAYYPGNKIHINYEPFTTSGARGTGRNRVADVHTWVVVGYGDIS